MSKEASSLLTDPEALFRYAAEVSLDHPEALVIGSVGRAAVMGVSLSPSRPSGMPRDIDVVRMGDRDTDSAHYDGHKVDFLFEDWIAPDGSQLVFPHDPSLAVPVRHPEIFSPQSTKVGDHVIQTPHPDVLGKIGTMQYIQRPKDKMMSQQYDAFLETRQERLPAEVLKPFDVLRHALSERHGYRARAVVRNGYHRSVPERVRSRIELGERLGWLRSR